MNEIIGVSFKNNEQINYFLVNNLNLKKDLPVIVMSKEGLKFGRTCTNLIKTKKDKNNYDLVIRIATEKDNYQNKKNERDNIEALKVSRDLVKENNLKINILDAEFNFDRSQLKFQFLANKRVDFRKLVRDLAKIFKTRIELRQIGIRDKAAQISGIGLCGRKLCCSCAFNELDTVTINMAKNQNLSLNPTKINGVCGRLLCCLKYEDDNYIEIKKHFPKIGSKIKLKEGIGEVQEINLMKGTYKVCVQGTLIEKQVEENGSIK